MPEVKLRQMDEARQLREPDIGNRGLLEVEGFEAKQPDQMGHPVSVIAE